MLNNIHKISIFLLCLTFAVNTYAWTLKIPENITYNVIENSYVSSLELRLFRQSLNYIKDPQCRQDLNTTLWSLINNEQWAIAMYDASVRNPIGIESSIQYQLGHFDQCLESYLTNNASNATLQPIRTQYCLADVPISNVMNSDANNRTIEIFITHWAQCLPATCNMDDISTFLQYMLHRNITVREQMCQLAKKEVPITKGMIVFACFLTFFLLISIVATFYHIYLKIFNGSDDVYKFNGTFTLSLLSFSIIGFYYSTPNGIHINSRCKESFKSSWWLNLLYVNNYINTDKLCMFQSWYLAVDTQLFILAPFLVMLLYRFRKTGIALMIVLSIITAYIPFVVTYLKELPPTFMVHPKDAEYISQSNYYKSTYIKTHMRASGYFIGILTGYFGQKMHSKGKKLHRNWIWLLWSMSCIFGLFPLFSLHLFYKFPYNVMTSSIYASLHKLSWNLANAWLVFAVTNGYGGWLQRLLSSRIFVPFSRLTYCAYLANGIVILIHTSTIRSPVFLNFYEIVNIMLAYTIDTFVIALGLCLLFESPIRGLERMIRQSFSPMQRNDKSSGHKTSTTRIDK